MALVPVEQEAKLKTMAERQASIAYRFIGQVF
jgi:hypothetical protein